MTASGPAEGPAADWAQAYLDALNSHDAGRMTAFLSEDSTYEDLAIGEFIQGRENIREFASQMESKLSSDYRFEYTGVTGDGEGYALEWTMTGTHDNGDPEHGLPATGRSFQIRGVSVGRQQDGWIVRNRDYWNLANFLQQVGLMPAPGDSAPTGS